MKNSELDIPLMDVAEWIGKNLPSCYTFVVKVYEDEMTIKIIDSSGHEFAQEFHRVRAAVNFARDQAGYGPA